MDLLLTLSLDQGRRAQGSSQELVEVDLDDGPLGIHEQREHTREGGFNGLGRLA